MEVLHRKNPELIQREVAFHRISHNLIRCMMQRRAHIHHVPLKQTSFKGSPDTFRHWSAVTAAAGDTPRKQNQLIDQMLAAIAVNRVSGRPEHNEPRAKTR